jgi:hypothetical protein
MRVLRSGMIAIALTGFGSATLLGVTSEPAQAQAQRLPTKFQYAVKTICTMRGEFGDGMAPGLYRTLINIHNPTEKKVEVARKFALAGTPGDPSGNFSIAPYRAFTLEPDQVVAFTCGAIAGMFCPINNVCIDFAAIDGFLVLNSAVEIDVVAVYSASPKGGEVSTLDTATVAPRAIAKVIEIKRPQQATPSDKKIEAEPFKAINP